jgi:hypothetical protein
LTNDREGKPEHKFDDDTWEQFLELDKYVKRTYRNFILIFLLEKGRLNI